MSSTLLLHFKDQAQAALNLARASGLGAAEVACHRFPDGELRLTLPFAEPGTPGAAPTPDTVVLYPRWRTFERIPKPSLAWLGARAKAQPDGPA